jgi:hypothetical protein
MQHQKKDIEDTMKNYIERETTEGTEKVNTTNKISDVYEGMVTTKITTTQNPSTTAIQHCSTKDTTVTQQQVLKKCKQS